MKTPEPRSRLLPSSVGVAYRCSWLATRALVGLSNGLLAVERVVIMSLMGLLATLILVNVVTRYAGMPIYWIDESAVYATVWLTFVGASAMMRLRLDFAVSLMTERLSARAQQIARVISALAVVVFGISLCVMCWLWMDPVGIARAGFDAKNYAGETFNFLYTERTQTLNWPSWVVFLVMPMIAISMTIHGLANVLEDLGLAPRTAFAGFAVTDSNGIN